MRSTPFKSLSYLFDNPGVAAVKKLLKVTQSRLGDRGIDLIDQHLFVSRPLDRPEDSNWLWKLGVFHARQHEGHGWVMQVDIVHKQIVFGDAVFTDRHDLGMSTVHANALVALFTKDQ